MVPGLKKSKSPGTFFEGPGENTNTTYMTKVIFSVKIMLVTCHTCHQGHNRRQDCQFEVLPGICEIESGGVRAGGALAVRLRYGHYCGGLACQKSTVAALAIA